jgi:N-acetyltransferase
MTKPISLPGHHVRLESLDPRHIDALAAAAAGGRELYRWSPVPQSKGEVTTYVESALADQKEGMAAPFAVIRQADNAVIGSTRLYNLERWAWPPNHPLHNRATPDACEIGYTWYAPAAVRTAANTESKLLLLTYAFETWQVLRVCLHTDARNERSRAAIERIGGKFEGILRAHRMASDFIPRDSARYSIIAAEWPEVKKKLEERLNRG